MPGGKREEPRTVTKALERGYVQVYTGEGKGKTTAAFGLAVRAAGAGLRVYIAQFVKGRPYSEAAALRPFADRITIRQFGRGCFIRGTPTPEDVRLAETGWAECERIVAGGRHDLVVLDEANVAAALGLFPVERMLSLAARKPRHVELVLTGRGADPRVLEAADLVTEMRDVKHYFRQGIPARTGIEC